MNCTKKNTVVIVNWLRFQKVMYSNRRCLPKIIWKNILDWHSSKHTTIKLILHRNQNTNSSNMSLQNLPCYLRHDLLVFSKSIPITTALCGKSSWVDTLLSLLLQSSCLHGMYLKKLWEGFWKEKAEFQDTVSMSHCVTWYTAARMIPVRSFLNICQ